jgi:hypothetical protein
MKKLATVVEVEGEGFEALLDQNVLVFGLNYIYTGKLVGVNKTFVKIEGARIVYETGPFSDKQYKDAQALPSSDWYVHLSAIESFGLGK